MAGVISGMALSQIFSKGAVPVVGFLLLFVAGWFWFGPDRDFAGAKHFDHAAIRQLQDGPEPVTITLDRILVSDAATVCIIAPYFDLALHDSPHAALIRQMNQDFSHDGVVRVGLFSPAGDMLADLSIRRTSMDIEHEFRSDCRLPGHFLVRLDRDAWSRMMVLQRQP